MYALDECSKLNSEESRGCSKPLKSSRNWEQNVT